MANVVQVDFVGNVSQLFAVTDQVASKLKASSQQFQNFGTNVAANIAEPVKRASAPVQKLSSDFLNLEKRALSLQTQLGKQSVLSRDLGFNVMSRQAADASAEAGRLQTTLRRLSAEAARTTDQTVLSRLNREAQAAQRELKETERILSGIKQVNIRSQVAPLTSGGPSVGEQRFGRINLARQGADVFTQAGSGASAGIIAIQQGPQIIEAIAQAGLTVGAAAAAISTAFAAAGLLFVKFSSEARTEAERMLKTEERIAATVNKSIIARKEAVEEYQKLVKTEAERRSFTQSVSTDDPSRLKELLRLREFFINSAPGAVSDENRQKYVQEAAEIQKKLASLTDEQTAKANESFSARSDFAKQLAQIEIDGARRASDASVEAEKKRKESVEKGLEKVKDLGEQYKTVFEQLRSQANSDNPVARIFADSDRALASLRKNLAGLSPELQSAAARMQQTITGREVFGARLDARLDASNFRNRAADFRNATRDQLLEQTDPDFLATLKKQEAAQRVRDQIDIINRRGLSKDERSIADSRLISLAGNLDPRSLGSNEQDAVASAFERKAVEAERREIEALREQQKQSQILAQIDAGIANLRGIAQKGGSAAVEIAIKNEADNAEVIKAPSQNDVRAIYDPDLVYGGPGVGLTNQ